MRGAGDRLEPVPAPLRNPARAEIDSRMSQGVFWREERVRHAEGYRLEEVVVVGIGK